jgi:O-antigen/teichoic acid export membrane protein
LSLYGAEILNNVLRFVSVAYLARVLGAEGFGKIGFATAVLAYFTLLINLGLDTFGTREVARDQTQVKPYVSNILGIRILSAILSFILLSIFVLLIPKSPEVKKLIIFFGLGLFTFSFTLEWVFLGIEKMEYIAFSRILQQIFYVTLIFLLIRRSEQILSIPIIQFGSAVVAILLLSYVFIQKFGFYKINFNFGSWKKILRQSLPMGLSFIMIQIYYNFDVILLGFMKSEEVVGWYSGAYKIILLINTIGLIYYNTIFPLVSRYYKSSLEKLKTLLTYTAKLMTMVVIPLGIGGVFTARPIMDLIYGEKFRGGVIAFQILIWVVCIIWISCVYGNSLLACDGQKKFLVGVSLGAITNIISNLILIPKFSLIGAAISTILAEGVVFVYMYHNFSKIVKIEFVKYLPKPLFAGIPMGLFLFWWGEKLNLIFLLLGAISIYFLVIFLVKGVTKEEILNLKREIVHTV